jgi:hypothetical protein
VTADHVFEIVNLVALASWVLLALSPWLPRAARGVASVATGTAVPVFLAFVYVALIALNWKGSEGGFSSLREVRALFANSWLLLAGWTHYLAFDLLVGNWEVRDARTRGISPVLVVPCLLLTFLFGPAGWLLYVIMRSSRPSTPAA